MQVLNFISSQVEHILFKLNLKVFKMNLYVSGYLILSKNKAQKAKS